MLGGVRTQGAVNTEAGLTFGVAPSAFASPSILSLVTQCHCELVKGWSQVDRGQSLDRRRGEGWRDEIRREKGGGGGKADSVTSAIQACLMRRLKQLKRGKERETPFTTHSPFSSSSSHPFFPFPTIPSTPPRRDETQSIRGEPGPGAETMRSSL